MAPMYYKCYPGFSFLENLSSCLSLSKTKEKRRVQRASDVELQSGSWTVSTTFLPHSNYICCFYRPKEPHIRWGHRQLSDGRPELPGQRCWGYQCWWLIMWHISFWVTVESVPIRMLRGIGRGCLHLLKPSWKSVADSDVLSTYWLTWKKTRGKLQNFSLVGVFLSEWAVFILHIVPVSAWSW